MKNAAEVVKGVGDFFLKFAQSMFGGVMQISKQSLTAGEEKRAAEENVAGTTHLRGNLMAPAPIKQQQLRRQQPTFAKSAEQLRNEQNRDRYNRYKDEHEKNSYIHDFAFLQTLVQPNSSYPVKISDKRQVVGIGLTKDDYAQGRYTTPEIHFGKTGYILDFGNAFAYLPYPSLPTALKYEGAYNMDLTDLLTRANLRVPQKDLHSQVLPAKWSGTVAVSGTNREMLQYVEKQMRSGRLVLSTSQPKPILQPTAEQASSNTARWDSDAFDAISAPPKPKFSLSTKPTARPAVATKKDKEENYKPSAPEFDPNNTPSGPRF